MQALLNAYTIQNFNSNSKLYRILHHVMPFNAIWMALFHNACSYNLYNTLRKKHKGTFNFNTIYHSMNIFSCTTKNPTHTQNTLLSQTLSPYIGNRKPSSIKFKITYTQVTFNPGSDKESLLQSIITFLYIMHNPGHQWHLYIPVYLCMLCITFKLNKYHCIIVEVHSSVIDSWLMDHSNYTGNNTAMQLLAITVLITGYQLSTYIATRIINFITWIKSTGYICMFKFLTFKSAKIKAHC